MADLSHITNFIEVTETLGTAGQPKAEQFADIKKAGYDTVINLAMPGEKALPEEGTLVSREGMVYVHIPVKWDAPQKADFDLFAKILNAHQGRRVFAHCVVNMRVSAFTFLYRIIHQGVDPSEAKKTMQQIWNPHGVWEELVDEILRDHGIDYFDID
jgi:protein tyrosine phosphatase (PTP) superfamily phosphohydrolase (DUF442 family)